MNPQANLVEGVHGHGAVQDNFLRSAARTLLLPNYEDVALSSSPFDWSQGYDVEQEISQTLKVPNFKIPVKDQNGSFSCGGEEVAYHMQVVEAIKTKVWSEKSAKYVYANARAVGGGTTHSALTACLKNKGICSERLLPSYDNGKAPSEAFMSDASQIGVEQDTDAATSTITASLPISLNIDSLAQAVRDNHGAKIGMTGQNNNTWFSVFPLLTNPYNGLPTWRHWLYVGKAKMINGKKYIGVLNSWGDKVGEQGWQWFGEEWFNGMIWQADAFIDERTNQELSISIHTALRMFLHDLTLHPIVTSGVPKPTL